METNFEGSPARTLIIICGMTLWMTFATTSVADTYSISPNPATVNENTGHLTFTVARSSSSTAATIYASTVHDQGYSNNGYYVGVTHNLAPRKPLRLKTDCRPLETTRQNPEPA